MIGKIFKENLRRTSGGWKEDSGRIRTNSKRILSDLEIFENVSNKIRRKFRRFEENWRNRRGLRGIERMLRKFKQDSMKVEKNSKIILEGFERDFKRDELLA